MTNSIEGINLTALSPVEKMELADVLYDTAQQELEARTAPLSDEQMLEISLRIGEADANHSPGESWDIVYARLHQRLA